MGLLVLDIVLFAGLIGLVIYGIVLTELITVLKVVISLLFVIKEIVFWSVMRNDTHMSGRYIVFLVVDILVLSIGIYYSSVPLVIAAAIAMSLTSAKIAYFIKRNRTDK